MTVDHPAIPPPVSRPWVLGAVLVWVVASLVSAWVAPDTIDPGPFSGRVTLVSDPVEGRYGWWSLGRSDRGILLLDVEERVGGKGDTLEVTGRIRGEPGRRGSIAYGARLVVSTYEVIAVSSSPLLEAGNNLRDVVIDRLQPMDDGRALLAGFLIGDTRDIHPSDIEAMRLSGLSHFVAVSGSNVALFLGLLSLVAGPLAMGPKRRAVLGLAALPIYAAATRFEPSVMRASAMAGLALGGRLVGVAFEAWQLLSLAVVALLVLDPPLTQSAGFQLSVAATAGVLVGARWPVAGRVPRALAVTIGAQLAVAPLILAHFGSVPLLSPLVNLVAAPVVAASTTLGALGIVGPVFLRDLAAWLAELVLELARGTASWPQLGGWPLLGLLLVGLVMLTVPLSRVWAAFVGAAVLAWMAIGHGPAVPDPGVVILDVGQGDSVLVHGGDGRYALVDGGPDAVRLQGLLRDFGVQSLELVVMTHVHADHVGGLTGVVGRIPVGAVWEDSAPHQTGLADEFLELVAEYGLPLHQPQPGDRYQLGSLEIVVEGPIRRYASPNDQSVVLTIRGPSRSILLSGDIETFAQADLSHLRADVLKVPHQGAGTSDPDWLESVGAELAVVSVGPNQFGHPVEWVVQTLEEGGAIVKRTDVDGSVAVPLG